ncbi:hypothetical protein B484DRAFT_451406 [Ochromonadaceae sp. CCMP2298]|nr:hypothetical protein B484DRAFT_451406 [Ochromonadaceae sp. CCMP2298]
MTSRFRRRAESYEEEGKGAEEGERAGTGAATVTATAAASAGELSYTDSSAGIAGADVGDITSCVGDVSGSQASNQASKQDSKGIQQGRQRSASIASHAPASASELDDLPEVSAVSADTQQSGASGGSGSSRVSGGSRVSGVSGGGADGAGGVVRKSNSKSMLRRFTSAFRARKSGTEAETESGGGEETGGGEGARADMAEQPEPQPVLPSTPAIKHAPSAAPPPALASAQQEQSEHGHVPVGPEAAPTAPNSSAPSSIPSYGSYGSSATATVPPRAPLPRAAYGPSAPASSFSSASAKAATLAALTFDLPPSAFAPSASAPSDSVPSVSAPSVSAPSPHPHPVSALVKRQSSAGMSSIGSGGSLGSAGSVDIGAMVNIGGRVPTNGRGLAGLLRGEGGVVGVGRTGADPKLQAPLVPTLGDHDVNISGIDSLAHYQQILQRCKRNDLQVSRLPLPLPHPLMGARGVEVSGLGGPDRSQSQSLLHDMQGIKKAAAARHRDGDVPSPYASPAVSTSPAASASPAASPAFASPGTIPMGNFPIGTIPGSREHVLENWRSIVSRSQPRSMHLSAEELAQMAHIVNNTRVKAGGETGDCRRVSGVPDPLWGLGVFRQWGGGGGSGEHGNKTGDVFIPRPLSTAQIDQTIRDNVFYSEWELAMGVRYSGSLCRVKGRRWVKRHFVLLLEPLKNPNILVTVGTGFNRQGVVTGRSAGGILQPDKQHLQSASFSASIPAPTTSASSGGSVSPLSRISPKSAILSTAASVATVAGSPDSARAGAGATEVAGTGTDTAQSQPTSPPPLQCYLLEYASALPSKWGTVPLTLLRSYPCANIVTILTDSRPRKHGLEFDITFRRLPFTVTSASPIGNTDVGSSHSGNGGIGGGAKVSTPPKPVKQSMADAVRAAGKAGRGQDTGETIQQIASSGEEEAQAAPESETAYEPVHTRWSKLFPGREKKEREEREKEGADAASASAPASTAIEEDEEEREEEEEGEEGEVEEYHDDASSQGGQGEQGGQESYYYRDGTLGAVNDTALAQNLKKGAGTGAGGESKGDLYTLRLRAESPDERLQWATILQAGTGHALYTNTTSY